MIRHPQTWHRWEAQWQRRTRADFETNARVFQTLLEHARALGVWPAVDPMAGIEIDIQIARDINTYVHPPADASGSGS